MSAKNKVLEISLLLYPNYQQSSVLGLTDLFTIANLFLEKHQTKQTKFIRVTHWTLKSKSKDPECVYDSHPDLERTKPGFLIIPSSLNYIISPAEAKPWAQWIQAQHKAGVTVCSVCSGAFLFAESGILKGRKATTHWLFGNSLQETFPEIQVDTDKLIIDDGDIITAGGLMAWIDLGLKLIDRLFGSTIMAETSRFMIVDPVGREQRNYSNFSPILYHGDEDILKVQHWLQTNWPGASLGLMAKKAGLEERTFMRRFQKATGMKPTEYTQHLRVGKAKEMLEFSKKNIEQISWDVGYEDPGAFRKVFRKVVGLTPGEYRSKFWVAAH